MNTDRWIEMDLFFFREKPFRAEARALLERLAPLYRDVEGDHGIVLCCAWLCDLVTEWNGDPAQTLPFRSPTMQAWAGYSYSDLKELFVVFKEEAARARLSRFKIGIMMVAWGKFDWGEGGGYDLQSGWYDRHPELYFTDFWRNIDYRKRLKADSHAYASLPGGIAEGTSFATFFSGQWALLSRFLAVDAVHFRDGFLGPAIYEMVGPFGEKGPRNPADYDEWSRELISFFTAAKAANPACLVMAYSSARSAVGEYRVGCFDLEALVASGGIDVWIDQTWAGAWQDWWTHEFRGWTFQLANLIAHHVMVVAGNRQRTTPCRHYHLIETWDAWEPWDTLHQTPMKLRWGMWAFTHAAVATPAGLSRTGGSYISWAHNWRGHLLSPDDVGFLQKNLNAAVENADLLEEVYGPALALNLPQMSTWRKSTPHLNAGDLIDDECAMLMKWGFPCLSGVGLDAPPVSREGYVLQNPSQLSPEWSEHVRSAATAYIAAGPGQHIDPRLLADIGVAEGSKEFGFGKHHLKQPASTADEVGKVASVSMAPSREFKAGTARVIVETEKTVLVAQAAEHVPHFLWQPPYPFTQTSSCLGQSQYGSLAPFIALVRAWQQAQADTAAARVHDLAGHQPVAFHVWRSGGRVFVLLGNLETGIIGDSRAPREITFTLNRAVLKLAKGPYVLENIDDGQSIASISRTDDRLVYSVALAPQGSAVFRLRNTLGEPNPATIPAPREDRMQLHRDYSAQAKKGGLDLLFLGDSITECWAYEGPQLWAERYAPRKAANFGIGSDRTEHVLWRVQNGTLDGCAPKVVVLLIGTNNVKRDTAPQIAEGVAAIVTEVRARLPKAKILLLGLFPRAETPDDWRRVKISEVNTHLARLDDGKTVFFLDLGPKFLRPDGTLGAEVMFDFLHLTTEGYRIWSDAMEPSLTELLK